jgi:uncharacterized protein Yka (UPF0111/DUF47 family)
MADLLGRFLVKFVYKETWSHRESMVLLLLNKSLLPIQREDCLNFLTQLSFLNVLVGV